MRYAWHCAYCGRASYFTHILPKPGYPLRAGDFLDSRDRPAEGKLACNFCEKPMIMASTSIRKVEG